MRRLAIAALAAGLMAVSVVGCGEWAGLGDIPGIDFRLDGPSEFTLPQDQQTMPFTAEGWHVNREDLCAGGTVTIDHLQSVNGETITSDEWADMFNTGMESEGIAELYQFQTFECDDGSGSFSMKVHVEYDFATFEFEEGELDDFGSWEIEEGKGTGSYADLSGHGDIEIHWDIDDVQYGGEVFP